MHMKKPVHIVFTTIYHPAVLDSLFENIARFNNLDVVKVWVVGDKKTPDSCGEMAARVSRQGLETVYLDIKMQEQWGRKCESFYNRLPYNNETRRNIGYLHAWENNCEIMISIDDDNYPLEDDLVGFHRNTGSTWKQGRLHEKTGFHNICEYLEFIPDRQIFPRGFPFRLRGTANQPVILDDGKSVVIGALGGLWLNDPDVDATTWLNGSIKGTGYNGLDIQVLDHSTWTPLNTQNTSIVRELIPAYLCIPMAWKVPGGSIQRYGDIWGGYFLQALIKETPYHIAFGRPLMDHRRNQHDYVDDLRFEYWGMILTDWLLQKLRKDFQPVASSITDRVDELANFIKSIIPELPDWCAHEIREFLLWTSGNLKTWAEACRTLDSKSEESSLSI